MNDLQLLSAAPVLPTFKPEISSAIIEQKESALAAGALIGRVSNKAENDAATDARKKLRALSGFIDRSRKDLTEPFVEIQRALIRAAEPHIDALKEEDARLEQLQKEFVLAEQRRVREEQEAQRRELERIERERQAEQRRIQEERDRAEREAREARERAERAEREATTKREREAADRARLEAEAKRREAEQISQHCEQRSALVEQNASLATRLEAKPVEIARSSGQSIRKRWKITQINDFQLVKARPDLVRRIEWDKVAITEILNSGMTLPGVTAEPDISVGTRGGPGMRAIDV